MQSNPLAWPKLWKHHQREKPETDRINLIARERNQTWLARYGGIIGIEWFFPKTETLNAAPRGLGEAQPGETLFACGILTTTSSATSHRVKIATNR